MVCTKPRYILFVINLITFFIALSKFSVPDSGEVLLVDCDFESAALVPDTGEVLLVNCAFEGARSRSFISQGLSRYVPDFLNPDIILMGVID